jgi:hypothetical protein
MDSRFRPPSSLILRDSHFLFRAFMYRAHRIEFIEFEFEY